MLEWHDFVEQLLSEESSFDGISLSFDGTAHSVGVPPIIKASVLMLDKMITHQGKFNILVFPERIQSIFIFTLIKLLHNIAEGKIERAYDPEAFKPGEKLKLGNAVVEFVGIEDEKNERRMKIKVADLTIIDAVLPEQLKMGDFVVVRETAKDLIREMADVILARSGKAGLREMAGKWKEALKIETLFYSDDEIYQHLQGAGCTKGYQAVRGWIHDDDVIAPQSRQDLEHIASATGSGVLKELLDQIYDAAQTVRSAHIQAGKVLSMHLKSRIVESLKECEDIDPFNIWEPIEMQVEGIGTVRILKIIDIGAPVTVDIADTNRLIDEE